MRTNKIYGMMIFSQRMRTKQQIGAEIKALRALVPTGKWRLKTERSIELAIEELKHGFDDTSPEFRELDSSHQDIIWVARNWKLGENDERPSRGWGDLVERKKNQFSGGGFG